ncbi:signal peptidase I [Sphaerimonospora thailandensis]|nr:signal peptidase I [Sphaerimonospora thailandensis]
MTNRALHVLLAILLTAASASCAVADRITGRQKAFTVPGRSMEPTIKHGSRVDARLTHGDYTPKVGDIIIFHAPRSWSDGRSGAREHIARVIGVPGSRVACCDPAGKVLLDGEPLDEPYLGAPPIYLLKFDVTVPQGRLWVMGDNRDQALDSRAYRTDPHHGTIPLSDVVGVVI